MRDAAETGEASGVLNPLLKTFDASKGAGTGNRGRYSNARFDALLDEALASVDPAARERLLREATPARVAKLRALGGKFAIAVAELLTFFDRKDPERYGAMGGPLHDPCTILYLLHPELFTARRAQVEICHDAGPAFGQTLADWWRLTDRPANTGILIDVDADGFFDALGSLLQRL